MVPLRNARYCRGKGLAMSHSLVFVKILADGSVKLAREGEPDAVALMIYRKVDQRSVPWHSYGTASEAWTWDEVRASLQIDRIEIRSSDSYSRVIDPETGVESFVRVPDEQHLRLHLGADSVHVGTMGQNYALLSRREFFNQIAGFLEAGFSLDTAGDLAGGSRSWFQVDLGPAAMAEVRKDDPVRASALFANSYDGSLAYTAGLVATRVVCANTLAVARAELREEGAVAYRAKHSGNIQGKSQNVAAMIAGHLAMFRDRIEAYKRLDSVKVRGALDLMRFAAFYQDAASDAKIKAGIDTLPKVSSRAYNAIEEAWENGAGSRRETYWDLFNAATFDLTHSLGNEKKGESNASRVGRRLDALMFGANSEKLDTAFRVASTMSSLIAGG